MHQFMVLVFSAAARPNGQPRQAGVARGVRGQHKICKCPTPGTEKAGKCPTVAGGGGGMGAAGID